MTLLLPGRHNNSGEGNEDQGEQSATEKYTPSPISVYFF